MVYVSQLSRLASETIPITTCLDLVWCFCIASLDTSWIMSTSFIYFIFARATSLFLPFTWCVISIHLTWCVISTHYVVCHFYTPYLVHHSYTLPDVSFPITLGESSNMLGGGGVKLIKKEIKNNSLYFNV